MNPYRKTDPAEIVKMWSGADLNQFHAAISAFKLIRRDGAGAEDDWWWAATTAAAYRAGRLSMWRDLRRRRGCKTGKGLEGLDHGDSEN